MLVCEGWLVLLSMIVGLAAGRDVGTNASTFQNMFVFPWRLWIKVKLNNDNVALPLCPCTRFTPDSNRMPMSALALPCLAADHCIPQFRINASGIREQTGTKPKTIVRLWSQTRAAQRQARLDFPRAIAFQSSSNVAT
jgi:hypothetical protein